MPTSLVGFLNANQKRSHRDAFLPFLLSLVLVPGTTTGDGSTSDSTTVMPPTDEYN